MTKQILDSRKKKKEIVVNSDIFCYLFFSCALNIHSINSALGNNDAAKPNNVESASEAAEAGNVTAAASAAATASKDPYAATVSAALSSMNINAGSSSIGGGAGGQASAVANASTMNNGAKDKTHSDVQKLQQQLNDIKEQVSNFLLFNDPDPLEIKIYSICRPCVRYVWTD